MIPSVNSTAHQTGDLTWHSAADTWPDQATASAAVHCSVLDSRYLNLNRQQILDWENAMLLAQHSNNNCSVYDQIVDYKPTIMQAEAIGSIANSRQYDGLLSVNMNSSGMQAQNTWGLLNAVGARSSGAAAGLQHEGSLIQASSVPYNYGSLGASAMGGGYSSLGANGLYGDPLATRSSVLGPTSFHQRRLEDIVKRELYTTHDFNSRLGLNLGGRTYFSTDDFAFGRFGKRLRPNSPCMLQAPLCQAEGCKADLSMAKHYHRRHKVCEYHSKAATVCVGDQTQRFCQQCSRFHVLSEFDDGKRSCRKRLADHNRRRRKPQPISSLAIDAEARDSQEAPTGSESLNQNGVQSSTKGSPTAGEQPLTLASATDTVTGLSSGHNDAGKSKKQVSEESMDETEQKEAPTSKNLKLGSATATSNIAASLCLGATQADVGESESGAHLNAARGDKLPVPWLQASSNKQLVGVSYNKKADHSSEALQHAMHAPSVDNLGFANHPLNPSLSKGDNIKFSSLHQQADLMTRSLSRSSIFGSDINHAHNNMI